MQENNKTKKSEKLQEEPAKLVGIERLKEIGLKEVSDKTFINLDNLTALLDKDFAKLNKTKAFGFIQILQREFGVDLSELKKEYVQFDNGHIEIKKEHQSIESIEADEEKSKKLLPYILLGSALALAAYLFFSQGDESKTIIQSDLNVVKNDPIVEEAKESLLAVDEVYEQETNDSEEVDLNKVVLEMFKVTEENESIQSNESLSSEEENESNESATDDNISEPVTSDIEETMTQEQSTLAQAVETPAPVKPMEEQERLVIPKKVKKPKKVENENRGGLYIKPIQKAWVGVIFLDSMKKKDFLITRPLVLNASKDQIILVGHKNFKIYNKQLEQGFKSKKMVMFLYKDGDLRELSKKEYDKYRGKARW